MKRCSVRLSSLAGVTGLLLLIALNACCDDSLFFHFNGEDWIDTTGLTQPSPTYPEGWVLGDCWGALGTAKYCFSIPSSFSIKAIRVMWFGMDACHFHGSYGGELLIWDRIDSEWDKIDDIRWNEPAPGEYWTHPWITNVVRYCGNYCFVVFSALDEDRYELRDGYFVTLYETGIGEEAVTDDSSPGLGLMQNVPNPFRCKTTISYQIPSESRVGLRIYNSSGRLVRILVDERVAGGSHSVDWDGMDDSGVDLPSGIYIYELSTGARSARGRMIRVR